MEPPTDDKLHGEKRAASATDPDTVVESAIPSTSVELPDATRNLLVSLPFDSDSELMDATPNLPYSTEPNDSITSRSETTPIWELPSTIPCSIKSVLWIRHCELVFASGQ